MEEGDLRNSKSHRRCADGTVEVLGKHTVPEAASALEADFYELVADTGVLLVRTEQELRTRPLAILAMYHHDEVAVRMAY